MTEKVTKKPIIKKTITAKKAAIKKISPKSEKTAKTSKVEKTTKTENIKVEEISDKKVKITKTKVSKPKTDNLDRVYATGKRKNAIAKVWLKKGSGKITINNKEPKEYLKRSILEVIVNVPFVTTNTQDKYDVICSVLGGGLSGQAGAIKQGIAKALNILNAEAYRKELKTAGLLTRDSRIVERKKPGLKKARKGQVFSKR